MVIESDDRLSLTLNSTQINDYLRCPMRWQLSSPLGRNLELKTRDKTAMSKGTFMHGLLERYYTKRWEGESWSMAMAYTQGKLAEVKKEVELPADDYIFLSNRFTQYCARYSDEQLKIATIERAGIKQPALEVGFSYPLVDNKDFLFVIEGRCDLIANQQEVELIVDHKIQKARQEIYGRSVQLQNYSLATGIRRGMHNYIRLAQNPNGDTFDRKLHYYGPEVLDRWKEYVTSIFFEIASLGRRENGDLKVKPNYGACSGEHFHACEYTSLCEQTNELIKLSKMGTEYQQKKEYRSWSLSEVQEKI